MNKTFLAFKDSAMASGIMSIKPQLAQDLKQTTEHFFSLTRIAVPVSDHKDEQTDDLQTHELDSPESDATRTRKRIKRDWSSRDATSRTSSLPAEAGRPLSIGYGVTYEEDKSNRSQENDHPPRSLRTDGSQGDRQSITMQQSRVGLPEMTDYRPSQSPMLDRLLHTPFTYSFQESTFARRLHRASIESAYHILTNPNSRKEDIYRIFKFAFFYADVNTITYRLRELLKRSSSENLESWAAPFFHLGGAGTHYPRIDARGHSILPPNMRAIGPLLSPETPQPENATTEQLLTLTGWDGEWFDANDVEQYLRAEKGLRLDGQSAFGEVEVPLSPFPTAASSDHTSPNSSSTGSLMERQSCVNDPLSSSELIFQSHDYFNTRNGLFNQINVPDMTMDLGDSLPPSESKVTDPFKYQLGHHGSTLHSLETEIPQTTLTIDVSRLLSGNSYHLSPPGRLCRCISLTSCVSRRDYPWRCMPRQLPRVAQSRCRFSFPHDHAGGILITSAS